MGVLRGLLAACGIAATVSVHAGAQLAVAAIVQKHAAISASAPSSLVLTSEDIARGYVDLPQEFVLRVRSNDPAGLALLFQSVGEAVSEVRVRGLGAELEFRSAGATTRVPGQLRGVARHHFELGYRFILAPGTRPGSYPWPVRITASPI